MAFNSFRQVIYRITDNPISSLKRCVNLVLDNETYSAKSLIVYLEPFAKLIYPKASEILLSMRSPFVYTF